MRLAEKLDWKELITTSKVAPRDLGCQGYSQHQNTFDSPAN
jgi:hypothetical protein